MRHTGRDVQVKHEESQRGGVAVDVIERAQRKASLGGFGESQRLSADCGAFRRPPTRMPP
jgi:hypothetical protein